MSETKAYAVTGPDGDVILATVRPTKGEAKGAAINALRQPVRWPALATAGYTVVPVAVRILDTGDPRDG